MIQLLDFVQILIIATSLQFSLVHSYPGGAPLEVCGNMIPQHNPFLPMKLKSDFSIKVNPNEDKSLNGNFIHFFIIN